MVNQYLKRILWSVEVPEELDRQLEEYVKHPKSSFKTKSEFIRDAVRKKLEVVKKEERVGDARKMEEEALKQVRRMEEEKKK